MEEWKAIPGYEGLYEASNLGRIRTAEGKTTSNARYPVRVWKQRILKAKVKQRIHSPKFAERVSLWKDGKEKTCLVARLVALAWCRGYKDGLTVNHKDGNPMNNKVENLEWLSAAENIRHGFDNGMYSNAKRCTLTDESGVKTTYRSLAEASKGIGRSHGYIHECLKKDKPILSREGELYGFT